MITDSTQSKSFISRYWKGSIPLPVAFWVAGGTLALLPLLPLFLPPIVERMSGAKWPDPKVVLAEIVAFSAIGLLVLGWWATGLWRSAGQHRSLAKAKGEWTLWAHLSRFVVVLVCLGLVPALGVRSAPLVAELYKIGVLGDPDIPAYHIRVFAGGEHVEVWGGIKHGLAADLAQVLEANPQARMLHLNSAGGRVGEAQQLAEFVRLRRLDTFVRFSCTSACTSIFLAGNQRLIEPTGLLGFHSVSFPGMTSEDQRSSNREWSTQLLLAGVAPSFIEQAIRVPAASMWYSPADELLAAHVITSVVPPGSMPVSVVAKEMLHRASEVGGARSFLSGLGGSYLLDALNAYPSELDELLISVQTAIDEGITASGNLAPLDPLIRNLTRHHATRLPTLHEAGVVHVLELYRSLFNRMGAFSEDACRVLLGQNPGGLDSAETHLLIEGLLEASGRVVRASAILPPAGGAVPLISPGDWQWFLASAGNRGLDQDAADRLEGGGEKANCADFVIAVDAALSMEGSPGRRVRGHLLRLVASL